MERYRVSFIFVSRYDIAQVNFIDLQTMLEGGSLPSIDELWSVLPVLEADSELTNRPEMGSSVDPSAVSIALATSSIEAHNSTAAGENADIDDVFSEPHNAAVASLSCWKSNDASGSCEQIHYQSPPENIMSVNVAAVETRGRVDKDGRGTASAIAGHSGIDADKLPTGMDEAGVSATSGALHCSTSAISTVSTVAGIENEAVAADRVVARTQMIDEISSQSTASQASVIVNSIGVQTTFSPSEYVHKDEVRLLQEINRTLTEKV